MSEQTDRLGPTLDPGVTYERFNGVWRRLDKIEETKPETMAANIKTLAEDVSGLRKAFYTFAVSSVGAAVIFAFSVFALLGKHST